MTALAEAAEVSKKEQLFIITENLHFKKLNIKVVKDVLDRQFLNEKPVFVNKVHGG